MAAARCAWCNDRFWGAVPKTDTVIVRSVDGAVTGAEQCAAQLQALCLRPQTTALTYGSP